MTWLSRLFSHRLWPLPWPRRPLEPLGPRGESLAADYVKSILHYKLLGRNVRCRSQELDLIALDRNDLVFIEVRTRSTEHYGAPERTITRAKRRHLLRAARYYIRTRHLHAYTPRFDTIAIILGPDGIPTIRHRRNAFPMSGR